MWNIKKLWQNPKPPIPPSGRLFTVQLLDKSLITERCHRAYREDDWVCVQEQIDWQWKDVGVLRSSCKWVPVYKNIKTYSRTGIIFYSTRAI